MSIALYMYVSIYRAHRKWLILHRIYDFIVACHNELHLIVYKENAGRSAGGWSPKAISAKLRPMVELDPWLPKVVYCTKFDDE